MERVRHPRIWHLPWSPGISSDDGVLKDLSGFQNNEVVVTAKMDGENTTMYNDGLHARSPNSGYHPSRSWVQRYWAEKVAGRIPDEDRICGENLFARHSIEYHYLPSYFLVHSMWTGPHCLSWDDTQKKAKELGMITVPELYRGSFDEKLLRHSYEALQGKLHRDDLEGYVVRVARPIDRDEYNNVVAKYVRPHHVQTDDHWMSQQVVKNGLENGNS